MENKRHIHSFNEHQENLNSELLKDTSSSISDVSESKEETIEIGGKKYKKILKNKLKL